MEPSPRKPVQLCCPSQIRQKRDKCPAWGRPCSAHSLLVTASQCFFSFPIKPLPLLSLPRWRKNTFRMALSIFFQWLWFFPTSSDLLNIGLWDAWGVDPTLVPSLWKSGKWHFGGPGLGHRKWPYICLLLSGMSTIEPSLPLLWGGSSQSMRGPFEERLTDNPNLPAVWMSHGKRRDLFQAV